LSIKKFLSTDKEFARPTPAQAVWQDLEIGAMICIGLETYLGVETDFEANIDILKIFNPTKLDTDNWIDVAESFGAKYIIIVAKHAGGFCLWQTDTSEYSIKNTPWRDGKGDILADLSESCQKRGMKLGVYLSPVDEFLGAYYGGSGKCKTAEAQTRYNEIYRQQLTELLTKYGEMMEVWFDGSLIVDVGDIIQNYASKAMIFQGPYATIRWVGNERGYAPYPVWNAVKKADAVSGVATSRHSDPDADTWLPIEVDTVIRDHFWFWNDRNSNKLKSFELLLEIYYRSVGHGTNLLLNIAPDDTGLIPEADAKRAADLGAEIKKRFGDSIADIRGEGEVIELSLPQPTNIDHVITMENIAEGQRIREYNIEGCIDGKWQQICSGTSIGHKKIDQFEPVKFSKIRLNCTEYADVPIIKKLAVYNTGADLVKFTLGTEEECTFERVELWHPGMLGDDWTRLEFDLSAFIPDPTQYEINLVKEAGNHELEVKSAMLLLDGREAPDFIEQLNTPDSYNINITATPTQKSGSIKLRVVARGKGGKDTYGVVLIQKVSG